MKRVKGMKVTADDFGEFDTVFRLESIAFENNLPHCVHLERPTEFYRYNGGKRFLVYADAEKLKNKFSQVLTLAITENGKLTNDRLFGDLFICNVGKNNAPISLTEDDEKLIRSQIAEEYFGYFPTRYLKADCKGEIK